MNTSYEIHSFHTYHSQMYLAKPFWDLITYPDGHKVWAVRHEKQYFNKQWGIVMESPALKKNRMQSYSWHDHLMLKETIRRFHNASSLIDRYFELKGFELLAYTISATPFRGKFIGLHNKPRMW